MNFMKRAFLSTKAKKGRTVLLAFVFSAILLFILAGLVIQSASLKATDNAKKSMGATVTLQANMENVMKQIQEGGEDGERPDPGSFTIPPIDGDSITLLSNLNNVASYSITSSTSVEAKSFDAITSDSNDEDQGNMGGPQMPQKSSGDITISGVNETAKATDFTSGTSEIVEGRGITADDENSNNAVIEANLAEANELAVGDTIKVTDENEKIRKLTIVGIYETSASADTRSMHMASLNPYNEIYTFYTFANILKGDDYEGTADAVLYTLLDPEKMNAFVKAAEKAGLDMETYSLQTNDQIYQQMIQPLENVESFAQKIVWVVSIAGTVILALIVILTIRERKYEIGVLLSLGEKRRKIIGQFFVELVFVLIIGLVVAGVVGQFVGNAVGKQLLAQQTTTTQTVTTVPQVGFGGGQGGPSGNSSDMPTPPSGGQGGPGSSSMPGQEERSESQQLDALEITLSVKELVELGGFGLGISFLAVIVASIGIMRMQPKKILIS